MLREQFSWSLHRSCAVGGSRRLLRSLNRLRSPLCRREGVLVCFRSLERSRRARGCVYGKYVVSCWWLELGREARSEVYDATRDLRLFGPGQSRVGIHWILWSVGSIICLFWDSGYKWIRREYSSSSCAAVKKLYQSSTSTPRSSKFVSNTLLESIGLGSLYTRRF